MRTSRMIMSHSNLSIRPTRKEDIPEVLDLYTAARIRMRAAGNYGQWINGYPGEADIQNDIRNGTGFVIEHDGAVCGAFAFIVGEDPTYGTIENGNWPNDLSYGTIHRIEGKKKTHGIFQRCVEYCLTVIPELRVDTHPDNALMRHVVEKCGFARCGIIHLQDGSPRIAYQLSRTQRSESPEA